jgi:ketosteroid isomerase-like protein
MTGSNGETAEMLYRALSQGGVQAARRFLATDVEIEEVMRTGPSARAIGHDGLARLLGRYEAQFSEFAMTPIEVLDGRSDKVLVCLRLGGLGLSGAELWGHAYHVHTVEQGCSVRIQIFIDRSQAARAAGIDSGLASELSR